MAKLNCNIAHLEEMSKNRDFLEGLEITQMLLIDFASGFDETDLIERYINDEGTEEINSAFIEWQNLENEFAQ